MKKSIYFFAIMVLLQACKRESTNAGISEDQLTDEQIRYMEAAGIDVTSTYEDALFPDGSSMSEWEKIYDSGYIYVFNARTDPSIDKVGAFTNAMTRAGFELTTRSKYSNFPNQEGLAYVYGSKFFANPTTYHGAVCQEPLYGLDCSGMIYQMAKASGVNISVGGTADYAKTSLLGKHDLYC